MMILGWAVAGGSHGVAGDGLAAVGWAGAGDGGEVGEVGEVGELCAREG